MLHFSDNSFEQSPSVLELLSNKDTSAFLKHFKWVVDRLDLQHPRKLHPSWLFIVRDDSDETADSADAKHKHSEMIEAQLFEDEKIFDTSLLNYQLFVARSLKNNSLRQKPSPSKVSTLDPLKANLDKEIENLTRLYGESKHNALEGLATLE